MPKRSLSYPRIRKHTDGRTFIDFNLNSKRYRLFNGNKIGSSLSPNSYPAKMRRAITTELAREVYEYLINNDYSFEKKVSKLELYDSLVAKKLAEPLSSTYKKTLNNLSVKLRHELQKKGSIKPTYIDSLILRYSNNTSYNTTRRHINVLVNFLKSNGFPIESSHLKSRKQEEVLHKPISNLKELLENIQSYSKNLYICALLTYGCLLRPHQEIRLLKWRDFSDDLSYITLSGSQVKSKRNRVVPVPEYIRKELTRSDVNNNIFTDTSKPYNNSYFKGVWRRFKKCFPSVVRDITLYSFRHTGAIEIYKRTGSLNKLQKAMGHSSLKISLTYLRGLEVEDLKEEDMPMI